MKRILLLIMLLAALYSSTQNLQVHYDMGKGRGFVTTTIDMFKSDKLGNTFFFIDMNYNSGDTEGISLAYWEISEFSKLRRCRLGFK